MDWLLASVNGLYLRCPRTPRSRRRNGCTTLRAGEGAHLDACDRPFPFERSPVFRPRQADRCRYGARPDPKALRGFSDRHSEFSQILVVGSRILIPARRSNSRRAPSPLRSVRRLIKPELLIPQRGRWVTCPQPYEKGPRLDRGCRCNAHGPGRKRVGCPGLRCEAPGHPAERCPRRSGRGVCVADRSLGLRQEHLT